MPEQPICKWVQLLRDRQQRDLDTQREQGLKWDQKAADRAVDFFRHLRHTKGEWAGKQFDLEKWQIDDVIAPIFGWKWADSGYRRFKKIYLTMARKNAKTTMAAGIASKLFLDDDEAGAEIYTAATMRAQAKICFEESRAQIRGLIQREPQLKRFISVHKHNMSIDARRCKFEPLGADHDTMDGLNPHGVVIDELHAHKTRGTYDKLETAIGARRQAMICCITTAGEDTASICFELEDYGRKVLEGIVDDPTFFPYIATLDEGDDWADRSVWGKANPNLGVSLYPSVLEDAFRMAQAQRTFLAPFKRYNLNLWIKAGTTWITDDEWKRCGGAIDIESLQGRQCVGGLDIGSVRDTTSFVLVFPDVPKAGHFSMLLWVFIPEHTVEDRGPRERELIRRWAQDGHITITAGNQADLPYVRSVICEQAERFDIGQIGFDIHQALETATLLGEEHGLEMVRVPQGYTHLSEPMKKIERSTLDQTLHHGDNPVLRWMISNTAPAQRGEDIKPDKRNPALRIDGVSAAATAINRMIAGDEGIATYQDWGVATV